MLNRCVALLIEWCHWFGVWLGAFRSPSWTSTGTTATRMWLTIPARRTSVGQSWWPSKSSAVSRSTSRSVRQKHETSLSLLFPPPPPTTHTVSLKHLTFLLQILLPSLPHYNSSVCRCAVGVCEKYSVMFIYYYFWVFMYTFLLTL